VPCGRNAKNERDREGEKKASEVSDDVKRKAEQKGSKNKESVLVWCVEPMQGNGDTTELDLLREEREKKKRRERKGKGVS
jgi:hypothetical protein